MLISLFVTFAAASLDLSHRAPPPKPVTISIKAQPPSETGFSARSCRGISDLSSHVSPMFTQKDNGEWECTYMLEYAETAHDPSVFVQIRGIRPETWSSFRLKLNFGSLLSRQALGSRAANLVYTLIGDDTPMRELAKTLAAGRDFELSFEGMTLRYKRERLDQMRFNLSGTKTTEQSAAGESND